MSEELVKPVQDYESAIDDQINRYFEQKRVTIDQAEMLEKRFIIKELALASKKVEIVRKLNESREERGLPLLNERFDLNYYQKEYAELIDSISREYALNIMKKYRFANRITRIAKLNEVAEGVLDRVKMREESAASGLLEPVPEKVHNENIKILAMLLGAIDEQMGKLKVTTIDVNLRNQSEKPIISNAADIQDMIKKAISEKYSQQLPSALDANFTETTDYPKCSFAEQWSGGHVHCQYHGEPCKVQSEELTLCPRFINRIVLENKEHLTNLYRDKNLSARTIAEIAGCKDVDERVIERVRSKLREFDLWRTASGSPD